MRAFKKKVLLALIFFGLSAGMVTAESIVVNVDSRANSWTNPVEIFLDAGEYVLSAAHPSDDPRALYVARNAWNGGTGGCDYIDGEWFCDIGWRWDIFLNGTVNSLGLAPEVLVRFGHPHHYFPLWVFENSAKNPPNSPSPELAFNRAEGIESTITLEYAGFVQFFDGDRQPGDNKGGVSVMIESVANVIEINIDIKPGSDRNPIKPKSNGVIPVAILGSEDFDVVGINRETLMLSGVGNFLKGNQDPSCSIEDTNHDGYSDLVCHFRDNSIAWEPGEGVATIRGLLLDGTMIEGMDSFVVVGK